MLGCALAAWLLVPGTAWAISLEDFIAEVIGTNPIVREQVHVYRQILQDKQIALAGWRPSLDVNAAVGGISRKAPNTLQNREDYDNWETDLSLTQNLFNGFDTTYQIEQAKARITAEAYRLYDTADNVALDAVKAYVNVLAQRRLVELAAQNVESHQRILEQIQELSDTGITRRSDVEQTQGRLARAQASLIAQQNNFQDALSELHRLFGAFLLPEDMVEAERPDLPEGELAELTDRALAAHPAVLSARRNIDATRADYKRSRRTDFPSVDLRLRQQLGDDLEGPFGRTNERSVTLNLRYNLYRGGADQAAQRQKASVIHESQAFLDRVRRQTIDTLRLAWTADRALAVQVAYLREHADRSRETVELYGEEFFLQKRNLLDVLDAEGELNRALIAEAEARYAALTARYRVYEGIGELFDALGLGVEVDDRGLKIASLEADGTDVPTLTLDRDSDGQSDDRDQCDNSGAAASPAAGDGYGCDKRPELELGYEASGRIFDALDDLFTVPAGERLAIAPSSLFANDQVSVLDEPRIRTFTQPANGRLSEDADRNLIYEPDPDFTGEDGFTYTLGDRRGRFATANVIIRVLAEPATPSEPARTVALAPVTSADDGTGPTSIEVVRFGYKQLTLTAESEARLDAMSAQLRRDVEAPVAVFAYTDNVGSARYNRRLSQRRADALKQMLVERGIDAGRIEAVGFGENSPIADNSTEEGRALNRRAEVRYSLPSDG